MQDTTLIDLEITPDVLRICQIAHSYNALQSKRHNIRHKLRKFKFNLSFKRNNPNWKKSEANYSSEGVVLKLQNMTINQLKYLVKKHSMLLSSAELDCHDHVRQFSLEFRSLANKLDFIVNYDESCFINFYLYKTKSSARINRHYIAKLALIKEMEDVLSS